VTLVLFWDIDGTLLVTGRAGILAWEGATAALLGRDVDLAALDTAGRTDVEIAAGLLARFGLDPARRDELVRGYEARLPESLARRTGRVLPGVREILDACRARADVCTLLLTGNTEAGGRAKLRHYGLASYFAHGAFADGAVDRPAVARQAERVARGLVGDAFDARRAFVIGDTPHDIRCAREIAARAVAVATGNYALADLERHEPWWALPELPDAGLFLERLRTAVAPAPPAR
jgi:phosphoglycolate phosphatase-like HAD superfamily hydrolase